MEDRALKLKAYIDEITLLQEKNPFDIDLLKKCIGKFDFTDDERDKLERIASGHIGRSEELLKAGKISGALAAMERAVEIHPLSDEYRNRLAQLYLIRSVREGFKKSDREMARQSAEFSLKLRRNNPIARSILKEIKAKEDRLSGRDLYRKLIIPVALLIVIITIALFTGNRFNLSFLGRKTQSVDTVPPTAVPEKPEAFKSLDVEPRITGRNDNSSLVIEKSQIASTNGSFSYTLQGEFSHEGAAVKSADFNIVFRDFEGSAIFSRKIPLVKGDRLILPGEPVLIDEFFYIHYLPPHIDSIDLSLTNLSFYDEIPEPPGEKELPVHWSAPRPEGVNIVFSLRDRNIYEGYSQGYGNFKISLENRGSRAVSRLEVELSWQNSFGDVMKSSREILISADNPSLDSGESRIFYIFTELPDREKDGEYELIININRIDT